MPTQRRILEKWLVGLLFLISTAVWGQGGSISGQAITPTGYPAAAASIRVCPSTSSGVPCTTLALLFSDPALTTAVGNPYTADGYGNYSVFVAGGQYYIVQITFTSNQVTYTYAYLVAAASDAEVSAAPQYSIPIYNLSGSYASLGEGYVSGNGALRSDATGGLYVPGATTLYSTLMVDGTASFASSLSAASLTDTSILSAAALCTDNTGLLATCSTTGTGAVVLANTPTLITPNIGAATGTSLVTTGNVTVGGTAKATIVNATTGFQINGAAASNHILLGNGTNYVDSSTIPSGAITNLYYQTVQEVGTSLAQQTILNFDGTVVASAGAGKTNVGLPTTGVTAGSYTLSNVTVDTYGRITVIADGTPIFTGTAGYQIIPSGLILEWGNTSSSSVTFPLTFPHSCFTVTATAVSSGSPGDRPVYLPYSSGSVPCTTTGFNAAFDYGGAGASWIAIGY